MRQSFEFLRSLVRSLNESRLPLELASRRKRRNAQSVLTSRRSSPRVDVVAVIVATPTSSVDPYVELRNSADGVLVSDNNSGADGDAFISTFTISSSGTYVVRVGKESASTVAGDYQLRIDVARGINIETDAQYANDSIAGADLIHLGQGAPTHSR